MSIGDELDAELKDAMRTQDRNRIDVIRQVNSEITRAATVPGFTGELDDDFRRGVIATYAKKMSKAVTEYESYGDRGAEMASKLRFEVDYLQRWLPQAVSAQETASIVDAAVQELSVDGIKAMGQVMGYVMKQYPELDGEVVSRLVRTRLMSDD